VEPTSSALHASAMPMIRKRAWDMVIVVLAMTTAGMLSS
jgi:hypothetical protein